MLREDPAFALDAARLSDMAKDVTEFLAEKGLPDADGATKLDVAYLAPCSMQHGQKVVRQPIDLMKAVGFTVRQPAESHLCCGSAGTYNILQPDLAAQLGDRKAANLDRLRPQVIATGNIGCATQIASRTGVPVVHTIELLDWATGGPLPPALSSNPALQQGL